jgi:hypothetical protein
MFGTGWHSRTRRLNMFRMTWQRKIVALPIACAAMLFSSCGPDAGPALQPVKGSAFFEGKPATGAIISFHKVGDPDKSNLPHAKVQADGTFTVTSRINGDGAPVGKYQVTVIWRKKKSGSGDEEGDWMLPLRYLTAETSGLAVEIKPGQTELEPFQLTK